MKQLINPMFEMKGEFSLEHIKAVMSNFFPCVSFLNIETPDDTWDPVFDVLGPWYLDPLTVILQIGKDESGNLTAYAGILHGYALIPLMEERYDFTTESLYTDFALLSAVFPEQKHYDSDEHALCTGNSNENLDFINIMNTIGDTVQHVSIMQVPRDIARKYFGRGSVLQKLYNSQAEYVEVAFAIEMSVGGQTAYLGTGGVAAVRENGIYPIQTIKRDSIHNFMKAIDMSKCTLVDSVCTHATF